MKVDVKGKGSAAEPEPGTDAAGRPGSPGGSAAEVKGDGKGGGKGSSSVADNNRTPKFGPGERRDQTAGNGSHSCMRCGIKGLLLSMLLLNMGDLKDPQDPNWEGRMWGWCRGCAGYEDDEKKEFSKLASKVHNEYMIFMGKKRDRVRDIEFKGRVALITHLSGGELSKNQVRKLALDRVVTFAMKLVEACEADPEYARKSILNTADYFRGVVRAAEDPNYVASSEAPGPLDGASLSYLTEVCSGLCVSYMCRHCGWFGLNSQWIRSGARERFRCTACGAEYRPWSTSGKEKTTAQLCVSYTCSDGTLMAYPASWPPSEEMGWVRKQILARAEQLGPIAESELEAFMTRNVEAIDKFAQKGGAPAHFKLNPWRPSVEARIDTGRFPVENWAWLKQNGFYGSWLDIENAGSWEIFTAWPDLIAYFAHVLAAGRQYKALMQKGAISAPELAGKDL